MPAERVEALAEIIKDGINNGYLIIDNSVTIFSFDKDGNLEYVTPREDHIEIIQKFNNDIEGILFCITNYYNVRESPFIT